MISSNTPDHWEFMTIADLHAGDLKKLNPFHFPEELFEHFSIPAYRDSQAPQLENGRDIRSQKIILPSHCVLFGKLNPRVEKVWNVKARTSSRRVASTEWLPIVPMNGVDQDFVYYLMHSHWVMPIAQKLVAGSTPSRQRVDSKAFYEIVVPLPALHEQKSIAGTLNIVQQVLRLQSTQIERLFAIKRAAMHTLFTRGLRSEAQKETEIGLVPESWGQTTLGDLCDGPDGKIQTGPFGSQLHKDDYEETGVPVVNPTHLNAGRINHGNVPRISHENANRLERHRLYVDDIVLARRGQIGRMARVTKSEDGWLCGTGSFLIRARQPYVDNRFLHFQLSTEPITRWLTANAAGAIMPNLNGMVLRQIPVFLPSVDEQREIVTILEAVDSKIDLHRRKRAVLDELFKALLHGLMTGEIGVGELGQSEIMHT
ncbi:MAG: hypothetical protein F4X40_08780 [Chloroflexi bacterium]|nr:hypothetical protein [Chloroflexota bacterium]